MASIGSFCVLILLSLSFRSCPASIPKTYLLEDYCGAEMSFSDSVILALGSHHIEICQVAFQTFEQSDRLLLDITKFNLIDGCHNTSMTMSDKLGSRVAGPLCEKLTRHIFNTSGNNVNINFKTVNPDIEGRILNITITAFRVSIDGQCQFNEFQCDNKLCLGKDLLCNGVDECSDNSDETRGCQNVDVMTAVESVEPPTGESSSFESTSHSTQESPSTEQSTSHETETSPSSETSESTPGTSEMTSEMSPESSEHTSPISSTETSTGGHSTSTKPQSRQNVGLVVGLTVPIVGIFVIVSIVLVCRWYHRRARYGQLV